MIVRFVLICLFTLQIANGTTNHHFHLLEFTTSDPRITRRCVSYDTIIKLNIGFVKETIDDFGRCTYLEFFEKPNVYFEAVDLPSKVKYNWTDTSLIQTLYNSDGKLFSEDYMIRPNKTEYILKDSKVIRIKDYFNDKLINIKNCYYIKIEEADFFMMYSGCEIKYNSNYRVKF
jgi:hypothetical protein